MQIASLHHHRRYSTKTPKKAPGIDQQTPVIKKDYNPIFNHSFPNVQLVGLSNTFVLEVWDWDKISSDLITSMVLSPGEILRIGAKLGKLHEVLMPQFRSEFTLPLKTKKKGSASSITLLITASWPAELQPLAPQQREQWLFQNGRGKLIKKFEELGMHKNFFDDLCSLNRFDIALVLDDSGSMGSRAGNRTRWDELREVAKIAIDVATTLDDDGIEVFFLNRGGKKAKKFSDLEDLFKAPPSGTTPLYEACLKAFKCKAPLKPLLVLIATDGVPNDLAAFTKLLQTRDASGIYVSILACSDNDQEVGYLNKLDAEVKNLDTLDDFESEKKEVVRRHCFQNVPYTLGDHVARLFLGSIFPAYDTLDGF